MSQTLASSSIEPLLEIVRQKVAAMGFGSVQIVVHEGRVTQVESTEKTRFAVDETPAPRRSSPRWLPRRLLHPQSTSENTTC